MASKSRNSIARALMIRPAQSLFFEKGPVCVLECANSEAWVADCINFLRLSSIKNQQGYWVSRSSGPAEPRSIYTSNELPRNRHVQSLFFRVAQPTGAPPWRRAPQGSSD